MMMFSQETEEDDASAFYFVHGDKLYADDVS